MRVKAQSELAGDCKSAAEMTAPPLCQGEATNRKPIIDFDHVDTALSAFDKPIVPNFDIPNIAGSVAKALDGITEVVIRLPWW